MKYSSNSDNECPLFFLDLVELAKRILGGLELLPSEQSLYDHTLRCEKCRNVLDSGLWFLQDDYVTESTSERCKPNEDDSSCVERLRNAVRETPCRPVTIREYVAEVFAKAEISPEKGAGLIGLSECGGLDSLKEVNQTTVRALNFLGVDEAFAKLALKCELLDLFPDPALAARQNVPGFLVSESANELLNRLIRDSVETGRVEAEQVNDCESIIDMYFRRISILES